AAFSAADGAPRDVFDLPRPPRADSEELTNAASSLRLPVPLPDGRVCVFLGEQLVVLRPGAAPPDLSALAPFVPHRGGATAAGAGRLEARDVLVTAGARGDLCVFELRPVSAKAGAP